MTMKTVNFLQVAGFVVSLSSGAMLAYVNFFRGPNAVTVVQKQVQVASISSQGESFKPVASRGPERDQITRGLAFVAQHYGLESVGIDGKPMFVDLASATSGEMVVAYHGLKDQVPYNAVDILNIDSSDFASVFHREGEDFNYFPVVAGEAGSRKTYLVLEDRTGAAGSYLNVSLIAYNGFGKAQEVFAQKDLFNSALYATAGSLLLDRNYAYYELKRKGNGIILDDYDAVKRLGGIVLSFSNEKGMWVFRNGQSDLSQQGKPMKLSVGDEVYLARAAGSGGPSVRTWVEGDGLDYISGPPVHIAATHVGMGSLVFTSSDESLPEFRIPIEIK